MNAGTYADLLTGVGDASVDSMRSHNLPQAALAPADRRAHAIVEGRGELERAGERADGRDLADDDTADVEPPDEEGTDE